MDLWVRLNPSIPRTVLVPSERIAHAFRRELALRPVEQRLLVGTRFARAVEIARERLLRSGPAPHEGREEILPVAIEALLAGPALVGKLVYGSIGQLRKGAGFAEAFTSTIADLSAAGVTVDRLKQAAGKAGDDVSRRRILDLAAVLEALKLEAVDRHEVLRRATALPPSESGLFFALFAQAPDASEINFLATLKDLQAVYLMANPPRPEADKIVEDIATRLGKPGPASPPVLEDKSEISILRRYLFARPEELADPARPCSACNDGTVHLEIHGGVADEMGATRDRGAEQAPIHVAGGLPAVDTPAGLRMLALLGVLACGLRVREFARVLPWLKFDKPVGSFERTHLSAGEVSHLVWNCGTLGGSPERRGDGERWSQGLSRLVDRLARLAVMKDVPERMEPEVENAKRHLESTRAVRPAVEDLVLLNARAAGGTALGPLWTAIREFWEKRVAAFDPSGAIAALGAKIDGLAALEAPGLDALRVIRDALLGLRRRMGRFGEPWIFIGTARDAAALPFDAVRVVGLAEGGVAGAPHEDPLLPDSDRLLLGAPIRLAAREPLLELHEVSRLVLHASTRVVFSAPRQTAGGTVREPSSIFLELAAALRRPNARTQARDADLLRFPAVYRDYLTPGRQARKDLFKVIAARPATSDVEQFILAQEAAAPGPLDGLLQEPRAVLLGSASALKTFLQCPHRFLLERVLHWKEAEALPDVHTLDSLTYGNLFHSVMETFFKRDAKEFYARKGKFPAHLDAARKEADRLFDELVLFYPLEGEARERERERLHEDVGHALRHEWERQGIEVVGIEKSFGFDDEVTIGGLTLHGFIDRIDVQGGSTSVRDYKTGSPKLLKPGDPPSPILDAQLAVYSMALRALAGAWKVPPPAAAGYVYVSRRQTPERSFKGDGFTALLAAGAEWLDLVKRLSQEGAYPQTPNPEDCGYCPFNPVCGPGGPARAAEKLGAMKGAVADFLALRQP